MTLKKTPWAPERLDAQLHGLKRYLGYICETCGESLRFVRNNACVTCKTLADYQSYTKSRYIRLDEVGTARISDEANRLFLSALAREKAGE